MWVRAMNLLSVVLTVGLTFSANGLTRFPDSQEVLFNEARTFALYVISDEALDSAHVLLVRDLRNGRVKEVMKFGRWVSVSWEKSGDRFFVNDFEGSNYSECKVAKIAESGDLFWIHLRSSSSIGCSSVDATDHCYQTCKSWVAKDRIAGRLVYYGDSQNVDESIDLMLSE
jgi:hypothetical protein